MKNKCLYNSHNITKCHEPVEYMIPFSAPHNVNEWRPACANHASLFDGAVKINKLEQAVQKIAEKA